MAILEKIALWRGFPAKTNLAILITNRHPENRLFSGCKTRTFDRSGGFSQ
jgi:hypothetical protein